MKRALVIGSQGGIGQALMKKLATHYVVSGLNRSNTQFTDQGLSQKAEELKTDFKTERPFDLIICTIGFLSSGEITPEKRLADINADALEQYFWVNSILPALCLKHFTPLLVNDSPTCFACLSAMVGSISDNRLGGWYGYRASKAALNMLIKTASVELARTNKLASVIAVHPGTTSGTLSEPFTKNRDKSSVYPPNLTADRIVNVCEQAPINSSGGLFNWNGERLAW